MIHSALTNQTVVVTGGAGLIGSFLVEVLLAHKAHVVVVDDFSKGMRANLSAFSGSIDIREGNLEDPKFALEALAEARTVFHLASRAYGIGYANGHHLDTLTHNELITNNVLAAIAKHRPTHLLIASSSCVYSDDGPDTIDERPVFEGNPEAANWGYGWAKRFLEQKAVMLSGETGTAVTIVRPFNVYGERYRWVGVYSQAIPMLVKRILDGEDPVVVWGSGQQRRTYVHARDCARIMVRLVERGWTEGPVNIGLEEAVSVRELVEAICRIAHRAPALKFDLTKPEGRFVKSADSSRLRLAVSDFPLVTVTLEDGLRRMFNWYKTTFPETEAKCNG